MTRLLFFAALVSVCLTAPSCKRNATEDPGPAIGYDGHLEAVHDVHISGWAYDKSRPDESVAVDILDGGKLLKTVKADIFRPDLRDAKMGNGKHEFKFPTPA